jgi:flagellin
MADSNVSLTAGMRSNLLLLQQITNQQTSTQQRLATGNKINSALDGANAFFQARGLNVRATDLSSLKDAMGQAISTISAADKGITSIESLIEQAKGLTNQAQSNLGTDASSTATRKSLAAQFNSIKDQIDKLAQDSGYGGKNLLLGDGLRFDSDSTNIATVNKITGLDGARTTNVSTSDAFAIRVSGTGQVKGNSADINNAQLARGLTGLKLSGTLNATSGSFDDVSIEMRGGAGVPRTVILSEGSDQRVAANLFTDQSAIAQVTKPGDASNSGAVTVTFAGVVEAGDVYNVRFGNVSVSYTVTGKEGSMSAIVQSIHSALSIAFLSANAPAGFSNAALVGTAAYDAAGGFKLSINAVKSGLVGSGAYTVSADAEQATSRTVSATFTSGTKIVFTVDRLAADSAPLNGDGISTIEKNYDIQVNVTNSAGVTQTRDGNTQRGQGKLAEGENAFQFGTATFRVGVAAKDIVTAALSASSASVAVKQQTNTTDANNLSVQFNEKNTAAITVFSSNVQTDGRGLRLDYAQNDWADRSDIQNAIDSITTATSKLRDASTSLGTSLNVVTARQDYTSEFSNVLTEGAGKLTLADGNQESANLITLNTRQQLGTIALSLANQAQQSILRLF